MSRKKQKKQDAQQKRIQVTDDAGWTHVMKGSRGQRQRRHISFPENGKPMEALTDLTVDKISDKFHRYCKKWKGSECFQNFQLILENNVLASEKVNLTRCVCLGLGSLTSEKASAASMYQFAFLSTTLEILGLSGVLISNTFSGLLPCSKEVRDRGRLSPGPSLQHPG